MLREASEVHGATRVRGLIQRAGVPFSGWKTARFLKCTTWRYIAGLARDRLDESVPVPALHATHQIHGPVGEQPASSYMGSSGVGHPTGGFPERIAGSNSKPKWDPMLGSLELAEKPPVSVLVITYNEEANIARCLES